MDRESLREAYFPGAGRGAYTARDAAQVLKTHARNVRRWMSGYTYQTLKGEISKGPAVVSGREFGGLLSFAELIELFVVREFLSRGVKLGHIVAVAETLASKIGPLPLASSELVVVAKTLYHRDGLLPVLTEGDIQLILNLGDTFFSRVDFDENRLSRAYWPLDRTRPVVMDAAKNYGHGIIADKGVPTEVIYDSFLAESNAERVCLIYELTMDEFEAAVVFERQLRAA